MKQKILLYYLILVILPLGACSYIVCYYCWSGENSYCAKKDVSKFARLPCQTSDKNSTIEVCAKVTATNFKPPLVIRGCFIVPKNVTVCTYIESIGSFVNCSTCPLGLCKRI